MRQVDRSVHEHLELRNEASGVYSTSEKLGLVQAVVGPDVFTRANPGTLGASVKPDNGIQKAALRTQFMCDSGVLIRMARI